MHVKQYFEEVGAIAKSIDIATIEKLVSELLALRKRGGRLFLLGVGGSAANCSHAVNDFRKLCGIEAYTPVDNVSELTARTNDEGWETVFAAWLRTSKANGNDAVFVFSVGGGNLEECQRQYRARPQRSQVPWNEDNGGSGARRWVYQAGRRCGGCCADRRPVQDHPTHRGISGSSLALSSVPSGPTADRDKVVGVHPLHLLVQIM